MTSQEDNHGSNARVLAPPTRTLLGLPPEVILLIVDCLPTTSAAILALCSKQFKFLLESETWSLLATLNSEDRVQFLTTLSRDLPRHYVCHGCIRLHLSSAVALPSDFYAKDSPDSCIPASMARDKSWSKNGTFNISSYLSGYRLRFPHVQLAMKRHHHGLEHGISLSDLSCTDCVLEDGRCFLFTVEARIVSNSLVMRSQEWVVSKNPIRKGDHYWDLWYSVCQHLSVIKRQIKGGDRLEKLLECRLGHTPEDKDCECMALQQCPYCPLDYKIELFDMGELGNAVCSTKWTNLGSGLSTSDEKWYAHDFLSFERNAYVPHNLPSGGIFSGFESQPGMSVEDLTVENTKRLLSSLNIVGKEMVRFHGCGWKLVCLCSWHQHWILASGENTMCDMRCSIDLVLRRLFASKLGILALLIALLWGGSVLSS